MLSWQGGCKWLQNASCECGCWWRTGQRIDGSLVRGLWRVSLEASGVLSTGLARAVCIIYGTDSLADSSFVAQLPWLCYWDTNAQILPRKFPMPGLRLWEPYWEDWVVGRETEKWAMLSLTRDGERALEWPQIWNAQNFLVCSFSFVNWITKPILFVFANVFHWKHLFDT